MKNIKKLALICCVLFISFYSCEKESVNDNLDITNSNIDNLDNIINNVIPDGRTAVTDVDLINAIRSLDLDTGIITTGDFHLPDGTVEERIYIGSDIAVTAQEIDDLTQIDPTGRQYRTFNLVTGTNRTINILGYTGGSQSLSSKAQTALGWAVDNYNNLNTTLQFNLTYGTNWQAADMVVYDNTVNNPGSTGGVAGFPNSNGEPNKFVQIYGIEQYSTNVNEHVIVHEIGHSVGFRHSDWFDRLSCPSSSQGNEGQGQNGAVHISGTPTGRDLTSIMQACFSSNEDGEFNGNDITALESMYTTVSSSPCDGVSEWQSGVNYPVGAQVTYFGNLYQRTNSGWTYLGPC